MSATASAMAVTERRQTAAAALGLGDHVQLDGKEGLVARVFRSREDVMVEVWSRGEFEHRTYFLEPNELVDTATAL